MSNLFKNHSSELKNQKRIEDLVIKFEPIRCKPDYRRESLKKKKQMYGYDSQKHETLKWYLESVR